MSASAAVAVQQQQVRKPYTITKQRERWTEEEHTKFLEALKLYGRAWRRIEEYIGTKTAVQIRSHAQKFFTKLEREQASGIVTIGHDIDVPPPRPKRKPSHPYPKKAGLSSTNSISSSDFLPLQLSSQCSSKQKQQQPEPETAAPPARSLSSSLKLFGVVLDPQKTASPPAAPSSKTEEESAVEESGVTSRGLNNSRVYGSSEVSSRDHDAPGQEHQQQLLDPDMVTQATQQLFAAFQAAGLHTEDPVALSNLIALHYASFLASFHAAAQSGVASPWQLLDTQKQQQPQQQQDGSDRADIIRWHSVTDSSSTPSPCADKLSSVTRAIGRKRPSVESAVDYNKRRKQKVAILQDDKCCSSSVTASSVDKEGDEEAGSLSTTLRLDREDNDPRVGAFVRLCHPNDEQRGRSVRSCTIQPPLKETGFVSSKERREKEQGS